MERAPECRSPPGAGLVRAVRSWPDAAALAAAVAEALADAAAQHHAAPHALMLAGGATPLDAYRLLTAAPPRRDAGLHLLFSDDRHVPPDDPRSNYGQLAPMLKAWGLPAQQVLRVAGESPLGEAARRYDQDLADFLARGGTIPLGLLGLGADGHTASLFTPEHAQAGLDTWALAVQRPDGLAGVSVTPRLLRRVQRILVVVSGSGKRPMARALLGAPASITAGLALAGHPLVELWTDEAARP